MSSAAATADEAHDEKDEKDKKKHPRDPAREVVETVVFVVVLVLLLKLFITEAFVIPTGSMAETLYGYQKIITCGKCSHQFPVNTHDEVEVNQNTKDKHFLVGYVCPNCRYQGDVTDLNPQPENRTGDRVLVLKPLYHIRSPRRGDVVVFKYPMEPQKNHVAANYIKRAMGFGGETVAIYRGDLYVTMSLAYPDGELYPRPVDAHDLWKHEYMYSSGQASAQGQQLFGLSREAGFTDRVPGGFRVVRKEEDQLLADRRLVWDNDKQPRDLVGRVKPRWEEFGTAGRWNPDNRDQPRAFAHNGESIDWLRYQHRTWKREKLTEEQLNRGEKPRLLPWRWPEDSGEPVPGPVDNMLGYNSGTDWNKAQNRMNRRDDSGPESALWVGDLILECEAEVAGGAEVVLELSRGPNRFQAKFGNGQVSLARVGPKGAEFGNPSRPCKVTNGKYKLRFANVDCRLWVWVDGKRIDFGAEADSDTAEATTTDADDHAKEGWVRENDIDQPAKIGAKGGVSVSAIKLHRDVYYTRNRGDQNVADVYYVQPGHFLCLGDNSAQSSDSRSWGTVPERLMLGKAVFVFWPGYPKPNRIGFIK